MTMNVGYAASTLILIGFFLVTILVVAIVVQTIRHGDDALAPAA
jgi:hypothetical protein